VGSSPLARRINICAPKELLHFAGFSRGAPGGLEGLLDAGPGPVRDSILTTGNEKENGMSEKY